MMGTLAASPAAATDISTSTEDTARLGFEAGTSAFMVNYTFAYGSALANAPDVAKEMGSAEYPRVVPNLPAKPPLGGFNLGVGAYSNNQDLAFQAAACLSNAKSELTATELDGLPPSRSNLYTNKVVEKAYPGFAPLVKHSIEAAGPRPLTPAYQDVSLGDPGRDPAAGRRSIPNDPSSVIRRVEVQPRRRRETGGALLNAVAGSVSRRRPPSRHRAQPLRSAAWAGCSARRR